MMTKTIALSSLLIGVIVTQIMGSAGAAFSFDLQGHRGARGLAPENTLVGFAKALEIGVSTLELDLAVTKDNVVVVVHNQHLEPELVRDAAGNWLSESGPAVHSLTLAALKQYDVGRLDPKTRYGQRYSTQAPADGARVPTLAEVFALVNKSGNDIVQFNIETKINPEKPDLSPSPRDFAQAVLKVIKEFGFESRVTLQSFDWRILQIVQELEPIISTSYLTASQRWTDNVKLGEPGPSPWLAGFDIDNFGGSIPQAVKTAGGAIWSSYHREVTAENVQAAHDLGLLVKVWTVNDRKQMEYLIDLKVDGIITDYPDVLRDVMAARGMPLPPSTPVKP